MGIYYNKLCTILYRHASRSNYRSLLRRSYTSCNKLKSQNSGFHIYCYKCRNHKSAKPIFSSNINNEHVSKNRLWNPRNILWHSVHYSSSFPVFFIFFEVFLYYIGSIFVPLIAILIVHYIYGEKKTVLLGTLEGIGLISWIIGIFASILAIESLGFGVTVVTLITTICVNILLLSFIATK